MSFQTAVNQFPAPAVEGDFASANPRAVILAGDIQTGRLVAVANALNGDPGLRIGRFAWCTLDGGGNPIGLANTGQGVPDGFVGRNQQGLLTAYLQEEGMIVPAGFGVYGYSQGDFWVKTRTSAARKQKVFASLIDGGASVAAAGSSIVDASFSGATATNVLTLAAAPSSGVVLPGAQLLGASVPAGTYIMPYGTGGTTGTGGAGTYQLSQAAGTIASEAMTTTDYVETPWSCEMAGSANNLIKMSSWGN